MIHYSPLENVAIPEVPLTEFVLRHAQDLRDKAALIDGPTGRILTYGQLEADVRSLAGGLCAMGFGSGHVLALMAANTPEYATVCSQPSAQRCASQHLGRGQRISRCGTRGDG